MKIELTIEGMLSELASIVAGDIVRLVALYGPIGIDPEQEIRELPVTKSMSILFDYGINARLKEGLNLSEILHECTDFILEVVPHSGMIELHAPSTFTGVCATVVERSVVRWGLDSGSVGSFTIKDISVLTSMDERSVRNAASTKLKNSLKTFADSTGTTRVARDDVLTWLEGRRGYTKTSYVSDHGGHSVPLDGFSDLTALGHFLQSVSSASGQLRDTILTLSGIEPDHPAWSSLKAKPFPFDPKAFTTVALELKLDPRTFVLAACKAFQRAELAWLEHTLQI